MPPIAVDTTRELARVRAILFDFGGTLYEISNSVTETWMRLLKETGIAFSETHFYEGLRKARALLDEQMEERIRSRRNPKMSEKEWITYNSFILKKMGIKKNNTIRIAKRVTQELKIVEEKYEIINGVKECLAALKRRYRLGIISNITHDIRGYLKKDGVIDFFDVIGLSYELGSWKPDGEIFLKCCKIIGVKPKNTIYVGDSVNCDVKAALNVGMIPILFDRSRKTTTECIRINEMLDLLMLLGT